VIAVLEQGLRMSGTPTFDLYILVGVILVAAVVVERYLPDERK
jgi:predicted ABC-type sugar transport system permease subunit